jgi:hypothetical protein
MKEYVKKPIPIKAVQLFDTDECAEQLQELGLDPVRVKYPEKQLVISTLEGEMRANEGDYIIKGVHGEFYPCKQDIFEESYDDYGDQEGRG